MHSTEELSHFMDSSALQIRYISPRIGQFLKKIFFFLIPLFNEKQINSLCSLDDPPSQGSRWDRGLSWAGWLGWSVCSVLVLASCSKLITPGYFPTGENVNITPRERCGSPPAAFLFMSFNSINGLLSPWTVLLLLYLYFL